METPRLLFYFGPVLILVCWLVQPVRLESQCMVINTVVSPGTVGSPYAQVRKTLNAFYECKRTPPTNASLCAPGPTYIFRTRVTASANTDPTTGTVNPFCNWVCRNTNGGTCATIRIDSGDGLPVELMDFGIDDGAVHGAGVEIEGGAEGQDDNAEVREVR